jgi:hypothetical protein
MTEAINVITETTTIGAVWFATIPDGDVLGIILRDSPVAEWRATLRTRLGGQKRVFSLGPADPKVLRLMIGHSMAILEVIPEIIEVNGGASELMEKLRGKPWASFFEAPANPDTTRAHARGQS